MLLKSAHRDRIDKIVTNNFVTDLRLTHPMPHLENLCEVFRKFEHDYRSLSDVLYSGGVQADTPVYI